MHKAGRTFSGAAPTNNRLMKILVVDDEKDVQRLFEQRFRKERRSGEVELFFAGSGQEALEFLAQKKGSGLALILSDINMPQMSGLELLQTVREQYPGLKIFMITAYSDEETRRQAMELGADAFFGKPLDFQALKEKLLD